MHVSNPCHDAAIAARLTGAQVYVYNNDWTDDGALCGVIPATAACTTAVVPCNDRSGLYVEIRGTASEPLNIVEVQAFSRSYGITRISKQTYVESLQIAAGDANIKVIRVIFGEC